MIEDRSKAINILTKAEISDFYSIPDFTDEEREHFFELNDFELKHVEQMRGVNSKISFILKIGYFKAKRRLFNLDKECDVREEDVSFILKKYFPKKRKASIILHKNSLKNQRDLILKMYSYSDSKENQNKILLKAKQMVSIDANPKYLFKEIVRYCLMNQLVLPRYRNMQKIISTALQEEEERIYDHLKKLITTDMADHLDNLLSKEERNNYLLTIIRTPSKGFSYNQVKQEIKKKESIEPLYEKAKTILDSLELSGHSIKYFARLAESYTIYKLNRFSKMKQYFFILCFIYFRYLKINDDLVKTLLYHINKYSNDVKTLADEKILKKKQENNSNLAKCSKLLGLFLDEDLDQSLFIDVKAEAFNILDKEKIIELKEYLSNSKTEKKEYRWKEYDHKYNVIKKNIRPIISHLEFSSDHDSAKRLLDGVLFLQTHLYPRKKDLTDMPIKFISPSENKYLYNKVKDPETNKVSKEIILSRYEIYLYKRLSKSIISGDVYLDHSMEYRSLEDDLLDQDYFNENYQKLCETFELPYLSDNFKNLIEGLVDTLESMIEEVNQSILNKKDPHFHYKKGRNGKYHWWFDYQATENKDVNNTIFTRLSQIDLYDLLRFVEKRVGFLDEFSHVLQKGTKKEMKESEMMASLIAYGVNLGLRTMAKNSSIAYNKLKTTSSNYLREETLNKANEKIVNATSHLPVFDFFNIHNEAIHSSSDGQKFYMAVQAFNARYSPKYFGLDKGLSVISLNANYLPLAAKVTSANEYEGNHLLELLLMNESEVKPLYHSTDTHGTNDINFALLELCGYTFAPRYKKLNYKDHMIYGTKNPKDYNQDFILKPNGKINTELIFEEEHNIKRIIATLMLKKSSVSTIVKKLSNTPKNNKTKKALSELDKIFKTIYILKYVSQLSLRQAVQISLNRGEAYHFLKRAVMYANGGKIKAKTEWEQMIYQESTRLICNAIIYFNSYILSKFLENKKQLQDKKEIEALKHVSPIAWIHIGLYGKYLFKRKSEIPIIENINEVVNDEKLVA